MKMIIFKYEISGLDSVVETDPDAKVLKVDAQNGRVMLWALIDPSRDPKYDRKFHFEIVGTGWVFEPKIGLSHLDTVQINGLVWHIFGDMPYV